MLEKHTLDFNYWKASQVEEGLGLFLVDSEWPKVRSMYISGAAAAAKSLQSCLTLCGPIDGSPPGSPIPGILPARTLEWGAISFSDISGR